MLVDSPATMRNCTCCLRSSQTIVWFIVPETRYRAILFCKFRILPSLTIDMPRKTALFNLISQKCNSHFKFAFLEERIALLLDVRT
jgi:hypothetical protein